MQGSYCIHPGCLWLNDWLRMWSRLLLDKVCLLRLTCSFSACYFISFFSTHHAYYQLCYMLPKLYFSQFSMLFELQHVFTVQLKYLSWLFWLTFWRQYMWYMRMTYEYWSLYAGLNWFVKLLILLHCFVCVCVCVCLCVCVCVCVCVVLEDIKAWEK